MPGGIQQYILFKLQRLKQLSQAHKVVEERFKSRSVTYCADTERPSSPAGNWLPLLPTQETFDPDFISAIIYLPLVEQSFTSHFK